jgi:hypothetical protein
MNQEHTTFDLFADIPSSRGGRPVPILRVIEISRNSLIGHVNVPPRDIQNLEVEYLGNKITNVILQYWTQIMLRYRASQSKRI